jgi:hypothetical protein
VRVNFNYFISEPVFEYVVEAVRLVARDGWRLMGQYRFDPARGLWVHRDGAVEPPLRLGQITYDAEGVMRYPRHVDTAPESALAGYLDEAAAIMRAATPPDLAAPIRVVSDDFEHLRWFELPATCLAGEAPSRGQPFGRQRRARTTDYAGVEPLSD